MRAIAAGLFAIAIAILILAGVVFATAPARVPQPCTIGGGSTGLPPLTLDCSRVQ